MRNLDGVTTVAAGRGHSLALKADGSVWGWGGNYHGQLGTGDRNALDAILPSKPLAVDGFTGTGIISAAAGFDTTYAVDGSQRVWVRGNNSFGQLGPGTDDVIDTATPHKVKNLRDVLKVAAGSHHCLALKDDDTLWSWGANSAGQLGHGGFASTPTAARVGQLDHVEAFPAGAAHNLVIAHHPE